MLAQGDNFEQVIVGVLQDGAVGGSLRFWFTFGPLMTL
jgi:hypothetical protein